MKRILAFRILSGLMIFVFPFGCASTRTETRSQTIKVSTNPPEASIWVGDETGQRELGQGSTSVKKDYEVQVGEFNRLWWLTTLSSLLIAPGVIMLTSGGPSFEIPDDLIATTMIASGGLATVLGMIFCIRGESIRGESLIKQHSLTLGADLDGYLTSKKDVPIPSEISSVNLLLKKAPVPRIGAALPKPVDKTAAAQEKAKIPLSDRIIVAVFDVHDSSNRFQKDTLIQLTTYLGTALTQSGKYKVIPRDQLRARLLEQKKDSYKACVDESCQIELGKVVSAQKSLATQLLRVGNKCAVTSNLFDLKTETAEKGAMVNTGCSPDELLDAMKNIAGQL